jgi:hypothetical protein
MEDPPPERGDAPAARSTAGGADARAANRGGLGGGGRGVGGSGTGYEGNQKRGGEGLSVKEAEDIAMAAAAKTSKKAMDPAVLLSDEQREVPIRNPAPAAESHRQRNVTPPTSALCPVIPSSQLSSLLLRHSLCDF